MTDTTPRTCPHCGTERGVTKRGDYRGASVAFYQEIPDGNEYIQAAWICPHCGGLVHHDENINRMLAVLRERDRSVNQLLDLLRRMGCNVTKEDLEKPFKGNKENTTNE